MTCVAVTFDAVGQSAAWEAFNDDHSKRSWNVHIGNWFAEHAVCPVDRIAYFRETDDGAHIGHFTQLIWADTQFVGCGYSYYTLDGVEGGKKYQGFYVCNYAPTGNVFSLPVYQAGPTCMACPDGLVCERFSGLCAVRFGR
ncbi:CRISP/Allergen/PR-1-like [Rhipicephalus sanguineus]|uniref:CRISP/Allergen/PR-1-like n=1 Tax=Rhipicephalus sanguineus TaxID=34632 RepID=UPI0020C531E2|nr:CRISP/Allergen/PR-1-like [Rhipicephalus sanguineus]